MSWATQTERNVDSIIKDTFYGILWNVCRHEIGNESVWKNQLYIFQSVVLLPKLSFYLDVPYPVAMRRRGIEVDKVASENTDAHNNQFWAFMCEKLGNLYIIDGTQSKEAVLDEALEIIHQSGVIDGT